MTQRFDLPTALDLLTHGRAVAQVGWGGRRLQIVEIVPGQAPKAWEPKPGDENAVWEEVSACLS